jgi:hypothetical protein
MSNEVKKTKVTCVFVDNESKVVNFFVENESKVFKTFLGLNYGENIEQIKTTLRNEFKHFPGFGRSARTPFWFNGRVIAYGECTESWIIYILWNLGKQTQQDITSIIARLNSENSSFYEQKKLSSVTLAEYSPSNYSHLKDCTVTYSCGDQLNYLTEQGFLNKERLLNCIEKQKRYFGLKVKVGIAGGLGAVGLIALFVKYGSNPKLVKFLEDTEDLGHRGLQINKRYQDLSQKYEKKYEASMNRGQRHINRATKQLSEGEKRVRTERKVRDRLGKRRGFFGGN